MPVVPVLFEDHLVPSFRPLAWSTPLFELRCGLFNTRERVELCLARANSGRPEPGLIGGVLARRLLSGLHTSPGWTADPAVIRSDLLARGDRVLLLNGRLASRFDLLDRLLEEDDPSSRDFAWFDRRGLLAARLPGDQAVKVIESWETWELGADQAGAWVQSGIDPGAWLVPDVVPGSDSIDLGDGVSLWGGNGNLAANIRKWVDDPRSLTLEWIWDIVTGTAEAIAGDLPLATNAGSWRRVPFGIFPDPAGGTPAWDGPLDLSAGPVPEGASVSDPTRFWAGSGVSLGAGLAVETGPGPVILDRGVVVQPHVYLEGPLYVGPGSLIKAGTCLYGESSFGIGCRLGGEIAESTFGDFANKQHAGFIGHAVLGSWVNLGALTTCSDLKNNYGNIRVDLGDGPVDTGRRFVGLMMGDHAKTAIGTLFNTGTTVGFASNVFDGGMPPKLVGNFRWGGSAEGPAYAVDKALETAAVVMARRGCLLGAPHRELFSALA